MSLGSDIVEEISEELDEELYIEDDDLDVDIYISDNLILPTTNPKEEHSDAIRTREYVAIENFSNNLAKSVLTEAFMINDVYEADQINVRQVDDIPQHDDGQTDVPKQAYHLYIIEKFLHSKADPIPVTREIGFDGNEEHFHSQEQTYPGLDKEDTYIQQNGRQLPDQDTSDSNNNKMDPFIESLPTIHEDQELFIDQSAEPEEKKRVTINDKVDAISPIVPVNVPADAPDSHKVESNYDSGIEQPDNTDDSFKEPLDISPDDCDTQTTHPVDDDNLDDESEDEETDCCEMTLKEKKRMVLAVRRGNIDRLEKLLEKKNADMTMTWYGENLLMVAIRARQQEMVEFLVDNGVDWKFETKLVEVDDKGGMTVHGLTCRQMAYDNNMSDCVELLDQKSKNLFPFIKPKPRDPRLRHPIIPIEPPCLEEALNANYMINPEDIDEMIREEKDRLCSLKNKQDNNGNNVVGDADNLKSKRTCSDLNLSHDELSQVFGRDEGYETMSPISPLMPLKFDYNIPDFSKHVSVRGTRASHLMRAHNTSKAELLKLRSSSAKKDIDSVGSYNFERRRWKLVHSAPQTRDSAVDDTPRSQMSTVRLGLPFIHGQDKLSPSANYNKPRAKTGRERAPPSSNTKLHHKYRSKSAHSTISPYSQVAKLLEQSKHFNPLLTAPSQLPTIKNAQTNNKCVVKTRINYIYADRGSAKSRHSDLLPSKSDLLPKRKLLC